jgi:hypothetical protein
MKKTLSLTSLILFASFAWAQTALPTGTAVKMKLETTLATFSSKAGDPFSARVTEAVVMDGNPGALPASQPLLSFPKTWCFPMETGSC